MTNKHLYIVLSLFICTNVVLGQDFSYKNQNKIPGSVNPSFYGFEKDQRKLNKYKKLIDKFESGELK